MPDQTDVRRARFEAFWNRELPQCDTTMTPRLPRTKDCGCDTYPDNLGPCIQMGELGPTGKCPYCDHTPKCHMKAVFDAGWQACEAEYEGLRTVAKEVVGVGKPSFEESDEIGNQYAGWEAKMPKKSQWLSICAKAVRTLAGRPA